MNTGSATEAKTAKYDAAIIRQATATRLRSR